MVDAFSINNLFITIDDQKIINDFSLRLEPGSVHALMGPNGSGKSSLANTLMGHPRYLVQHGCVTYKDNNILDLTPDKRAQLGIFLALQYPLEVPGLSLYTFLKESYMACSQHVRTVEEFKIKLDEYLALLALDAAFVQRNLNEGFSGGQKKRFEMLQMLLLQPSCVILDEIDSGLDVDALKVVAHAIAYARKNNPAMITLIITHYQRILNYVVPDFVHIVCNGSLVASGNKQLALDIEQQGYDVYSAK